MAELSIPSSLAWSHALGALAFAAFAVWLAAGFKSNLRAAVLLGAVVASVLWSVGVAVSAGTADLVSWGTVRALYAVQLAAWYAFLLLLLDGWQPGLEARPWSRVPRWFVALVASLLVAATVLPQSPPWASDADTVSGTASFAALLGVSVLGLWIAEQLYRGTPDHEHWAVKPLAIGMAGMFAFDLFLYSDAMLFRKLDPDLLAAQAIAHVVVIPFIAVATRRNASWTVNLHASRGLVFHSTALLFSGFYLLFVAGAGYWVRFFGGSWGKTLEVAIIFAALVGLAALGLSGSLRSRLRVFINKHFFSYRYDYRYEWLRFTRALASPQPGTTLYEQVVRALADPVESLGGSLWLERDGSYRNVTHVNLPEVKESEPLSGSLAQFLTRTGWVVRLDELAGTPERYPELTAPAWLAEMKGAWLVVPLASGAELLGFVVLAHPRAPLEVNWEVLDLLKTASRQAASYVAQLRANESLLEVQKFDAFNRMSAFVVHDLKNLVAQLTLLLRNAERHRENPEFQRDMFATVEHVAGRMNHLMMQLRSGTSPMEKPRSVDLFGVLNRIAAAKARELPSLRVEVGRGVRALGHEERLERVIGHLVQNAIDATDASGKVSVSAAIEGGSAVVVVTDDGVGMTLEFVRERLFRAFQTTKPQGMGIGMYESLQYVASVGGRIEVDSVPGRGSRFRVSLPLAEASIEVESDDDHRKVA